MPVERRYLGIDLFRGAALLLMLLVGSRSPFSQLRHGSWYEVTVADLVYPAFLFIAGVSMALSVGVGLAAGSSRQCIARRIAVRLSRLFLVGFLLTAVANRNVAISSGTLQSIAVAMLVAVPAAFALTTRSKLVLFIIGVAILNVALIWWAALINDLSCHSAWMPDSNLARQIDLLVFGSYRGVEGVYGSVSSGLFVILGITVGSWLGEPSFFRLSAILATCLFCCAVVWPFLAIDPCYQAPIVARLVSGPFVLLVGAALIALFSLCAAALDLYRARHFKILMPVARVGENPLLIFVAVKLFHDLLLKAEIGPAGMPLTEYLRSVVGEILQRAGLESEFRMLTVPLIKVIFALALSTLLAVKRIRFRL